MILDFNIGESNEFFRIKKILDELKESKDYKKDRIIVLSSVADKLYRNLEIKTDVNNIKGYKFSGTSVVTATMNEEALIKETMKAVEERLNFDVAIDNLSSLVRFWKTSSLEKNVYKPFLFEVINILNETSAYLEESRNVEAIREVIKSKEDVIEGLKKESLTFEETIKINESKYKRYEMAIQPFLDNWNIVRDLLNYRLSTDPIKSHLMENYSDIIMCLLLSRGRDSVVNICNELNMTKERVFEVVNAYETLILNDTQTMVGIINKPSYKFDTEAYLNDIMEKKIKPDNKIEVE